jgi:hypothetical protein
MPIINQSGTIVYTEPQKKQLALDTFSFADEDFSIHDKDNVLKQIHFNVNPTTTGPGSVTIQVDVNSTDQVFNLGTLATLDSFKIMQPDFGTSPTASTASDTLTFTSSDGSITITGNAGTKTLNFQGQSFTAGITLPQIATPSNPAVGYNKIYPKSDDKLYILTSAGVETQVGVGSVTSVGLSAPSEFTVSGSPVTGAGTLTFSKANQTANTVYSGPSTGSPAAPTFRALVSDDIPSLPANKLPLASTSLDGYLSSTDWNTFNDKQKQIIGNPLQIYIDSDIGDDTLGDGSVGNPIQTLHKGVTLVTNPAEQYVFMLAPGPYSGIPLSIPGNVSIVGREASVQCDITLTAVAASEIAPVYSGTGFNNFTMDISAANIALPVFLSAGFSITRLDATTGPHFVRIHDGQINDLDLTGAASLDNILFTGSCTVQTGGQLLLTSSILSIPVDAYGTAVINMSGCTFNGSITGNTIGMDTPSVVTDSSSMYSGGTITGCTITYADNASTIAYSPATPADWTTVPAIVSDALDYLAAVRVSNLDGGSAGSVYGGTTPIDGGSA